MATADESSTFSRDITECSMCLQKFKEPKGLPCMHTFCLDCLKSYCEDKQAGNDMLCPMCRKVFVIPEGGVDNLPTNFFITQFLKVINSPHASQKRDKPELCEVCSDMDGNVLSTSFCIECDEHICERCSQAHKDSKSHRVISDNGNEGPSKRLKLAVSYCEDHPGEQNRSYCRDCKVVMCHRCHFSQHNKHDITDINISAEAFRKQLREDEQNLYAFASRKHIQLDKLEKQSVIIVDKINSTQRDVLGKFDELMSVIQSRKDQMMEELGTFQEKVLTNIAVKKDEVKIQLGDAESCVKDCQEMINKAIPYEISRGTPDLHARAEELLKSNIRIKSRIQVTFKPAAVMTEDVKNFTGELVLIIKSNKGGNKKNKPVAAAASKKNKAKKVDVKPSLAAKRKVDKKAETPGKASVTSSAKTKEKKKKKPFATDDGSLDEEPLVPATTAESSAPPNVFDAFPKFDLTSKKEFIKTTVKDIIR